MIWAAIGYNGKTDLTFIETRMNAIGYQEMISLHFPAHWKDLAVHCGRFNVATSTSRSDIDFELLQHKISLF